MKNELIRIDPAVPTEILLLLLLLGALIFIWDLLDRRARKLRASSGLTEKSRVVAVRGSDLLPSRDFYSEELGLASKPYALIREGGYLIPVDIFPLSKKVKDRHVGQLFVHLKLVEAVEGRRPPYGILIMGSDERRVRINNTEEKHRWLDSLLDEMHSIAEGIPALPAPAPFKCKSCDVREICTHSVYKPRRGREEDQGGDE